jgi:hypothetical protein
VRATHIVLDGGSQLDVTVGHSGGCRNGDLAAPSRRRQWLLARWRGGISRSEVLFRLNPNVCRIASIRKPTEDLSRITIVLRGVEVQRQCE